MMQFGGPKETGLPLYVRMQSTGVVHKGDYYMARLISYLVSCRSGTKVFGSFLHQLEKSPS